MTDNEIKKALECCGFDEDMCLDCPVQCDCEKDTEAMIDRAKAILDLINRLEAEDKRLNNELHGKVEYIHEQRDIINENKAEIGRLQHLIVAFTNEVCTWIDTKGYDATELSIERMVKNSENIVANIKAEARTEFANNLKEDIKSHRLEMNLNGLKGTHRTDELTYQTLLEYIDSLLEDEVQL